MEAPRIIQGRLVTEEDLRQIRDLLSSHPQWHRTQVSRELCRLWQWTDATGRPKDMACRTLLLKLERKGELSLPPRRGPSVNHRRGHSRQTVAHDQTPVTGSLDGLRPIRLLAADSGPLRALWETLLTQYHYLGFKTRVGKSLCYLAVDVMDRPVSCLLFGAAAWKTAARDRFIGWNPQQRAAHLHEVVNNMRFLILPWVTVPHLASHLLGKALRQLPGDWHRRYGHPVWLVETFVDRDRFAGTCYRAANWLHVGDTAGRSRNDVKHRLAVPPKTVWLRPLCRGFREKLTRE